MKNVQVLRLPCSFFPNLITYGNGILAVKLKHIVSNMSRSIARRCCRSLSTIYKFLFRLSQYALELRALVPQGPWCRYPPLHWDFLILQRALDIGLSMPLQAAPEVFSAYHVLW